MHQSFTTREEALRRFQEAQARGAIQIVDPDAPPNGPRRPSGNSPRPFTSSAPSRTPVHALVPTRMNSSHTSPDRIRHTTSPQTLPSSPLSWSSSEPSPKLSRLQEIQTAFDRLAVGAESRASSVMSSTRSSPATRSVRTSTPTAEVSGRSLQRASTASPEIFRGSRCPADNVSSRTPHVIVRTPSWIRSHPKTSTPGPSEGTLSPLSSVNLKLHSFPVGDRHDYDISHSPRAPRRSPSNKTPSPSCSSNNALNQATTSGDVRAGQRIIRTRQIMHDTDPRSPILDQSQVPELVYEKYGPLNPILRSSDTDETIQHLLFYPTVATSTA